MNTAVIDLSPLINGVLFPILQAVLLAVLTWAATKVAALAHFQLQDGQRKVVGDAVTNGLAYAEQALAGKESLTADAKVAAAVNYILPKIPGALASLNITPDHLAQLVTARLPAVAPAQ